MTGLAESVYVPDKRWFASGRGGRQDVRRALAAAKRPVIIPVLAVVGRDKARHRSFCHGLEHSVLVGFAVQDYVNNDLPTYAGSSASP